MKDKDKIYFNACLYAIDKLVEKGSRSYCFKTDDGWHSVTWGDTMSWILEKLNAESDKLKADDELLDKIRAEIMQLDYDIDSVDYDYNDMTYTEEVHTIHREEVLQILDEHKVKSDEK